MNADPITVIVGHPSGDPAIQTAMQHLVALSERRLLRPFWFVDASGMPDEQVEAALVRSGAVIPEPMFRSIAGVRRPSVTRLILTLTDAASIQAIDESLDFIDALRGVMTPLQPPGVPLKSIRMAFPTAVDRPSPLSRMFDTFADANLVVSPEDRSSDLDIAAPVTTEFEDAFGAHVAAEIATQCGLWIALDEAPCDTSVMGTVDGNEIPVRFVRSYARAAIGPSLPLNEAMEVGHVLPVPSRTQQSPNQWASSRDFADALFNQFDEFHFHDTSFGESERIRLGRGEGARVYFRELGAYLRDIPRSLRRSFGDDVGELGGELLLTALGEQSRIEVDWVGRDPNRPQDESLEGHIESLTGGLRRRQEILDLGTIEATPIDQSVWTRIVQDVTAAVDGGLEASTRITVGATRLVVNDPSMAGPSVEQGLDDSLRRVVEERLDNSSGTILGRISSRIRNEVGHAESTFRSHLADLESAISRAQVGLLRPLPFVTWSIGVLSALILVLLAIGFGVPKLIGMDGWSQRDRYVIGLVVAALALGVGAFCLGSAQRVVNGFRRAIPWAVCSLLIGLAAASWFLLERFTTPNLRFLWSPVKELIAMVAVALCLVTGIVFAALARNKGYRTMARLIGVDLVVYLSCAVIGIVVRPGGWYTFQSSTAVRTQCLKYSGLALIVLLILFVILCINRIRQRLEFFDALRRIRDHAEAARLTTVELVRLRVVHQQYLGTALAIDRVVHLPFGSHEHERFVPPVGEDPFQALKVSLHYFEMEGKALKGAIARIRNLVATPGWINRQYAVAARAFLPEFAEQTGRDPDEITDLRPEMDATIELSSGDFTGQGEGPRWNFARMLFDGTFDGELAQAGIDVVMTDALTKFLTPSVVGGGADAHAGIADHGMELLAGQRPRLTAEVLRNGLFVAGDDRGRFDATVWWPTVLEVPSEIPPNTTLRPSGVNQADRRQLVIEFARSDWSGVFPLSELRIDSSPSGRKGPVEPGSENPPKHRPKM